MLKRLGFWRRPISYFLILTSINTVTLVNFVWPNQPFDGIVTLLIVFIGPHILYRLLPIVLYKWKIYPCPKPLAQRIKAEAYRRSITIRQVYIYKSKQPNAFALGYGRQRYIGITEGLFEDYTEAEIMAVIAHEIGHHYYNDSLLQILTLDLVILVNLIVNLWLTYSFNLTSGVSLFILCLCTTLFSLAYLLFITRCREQRADRFAHRILDQPSDLASFLEKAVIFYEKKGYTLPLHPSKLLRIFLDHPWIHDRITYFQSH